MKSKNAPFRQNSGPTDGELAAYYAKRHRRETTILEKMTPQQMGKALQGMKEALKNKPQPKETLQVPTSSGGKTSSTAESRSSFVEGFIAHLMHTKGISMEAAEEWASWL